MARNDRFESMFGDLVAAWSHHQQLKATGASIAELFESRQQLDQVRAATARARGLRRSRSVSW